MVVDVRLAVIISPLRVYIAIMPLMKKADAPEL